MIPLMLIGQLRDCWPGAPSIVMRLPIEPISAVHHQMFERDQEMRILWTILRRIQLAHHAKTFACVKDVRNRQFRSRGVE